MLEGTVSHNEGPRGYILVCPLSVFCFWVRAPQWNSEVELMASELGFWERIVTFLLTVLSLSCGTQDLFIVCAGLVAPWQVGSWFPNQGSNLPRLHWEEDS